MLIIVEMAVLVEKGQQYVKNPHIFKNGRMQFELGIQYDDKRVGD